jgi:hypothetical protein
MRLLVTTLLLALSGASLTGCAVGGPGSAAAPATPSSPPAATATAPAPSSSPAAQAQRVGSVVPQPPREIQLPDGHRMEVAAVASRHNGLLDVPDDIGAAGWWRGGSRIGDPFGSTLIAAHVDSFTQGLGPFASLLSVHAGDHVVVWSKGLRQTFTVTSLRLRPRASTIGPGAWLHSPRGPRRLTLVTCAGPYDAAHGGYQNLAVITAAPLGDPVPRTGA